MKKVFLLTVTLATIISTATAQVSKGEFTSTITSFSNYTKQGNTGARSTTLDRLNTLMNNQVNWLKSAITAQQAQATADEHNAQTEITKADNAKAKALAAQTAAAKESGAQSTNDMAKAMDQLTQARADEQKAHNDQKNAENENAKIAGYQKSLNTEQAAYNDIQNLKGKNTPTDNDKIIADLNSFASTLN